MKKMILLLTGVLVSGCLYSQIYVGLQTGYGIGAQGRTLVDFLLVNGSFNNTTTDDVIMDKRASFGGGVKAGAIIGWNINKYVGVELNSNYHLTNTISTKTTDQFNNEETNVSMNGRILSINPTIVGKFYQKGTKVYSKLGAVYNVGKFIFNYSNKSVSSSTSYSFDINKGHALGVSCAVGADWKIKHSLFLRTELNYIAANYYPKHGELVKFEMNGKNQMQSIQAKDYEITYTKSATSDGELYGSAIGSGNILRPQIPMNGFGLVIGFYCELH